MVIAAYQKNDALLRDVAQAMRDPEAVHIWWLGQSGFLAQWNGLYILFDPYLSDSLTRKYADTETPHVRATELPVDPVRLGCIDVVTSSHNHTDHLDGETLRALMDANEDLKLVVPEANRAFAAERLGCNPAWLVGIMDGETKMVGDFMFSAVPAAHEEIERDSAGCCVYLGYVVRMEPWRVYHGGDTVHYPRMEELLADHRVDVALLPINGRKPERNVAGNLNGEEAARLAKAIGARQAVPCHYDMFESNTEPPDLFVDTCTRIEQPYTVLRCGERLSLRNSQSS
ncbi:MAG: MBL fold metallo-hydrolase [Candidatus Hydrogenedentes bacterium]|nr:MBL fold metallo-hydrolase [Candidatus Hydrogenedentota bacterium]